MKITNKELKASFKSANREFFKNALDETIVRFAPIKHMGVTSRKTTTRKTTAKERRENGLNKTAIAIVPKFTILINKDYQNSLSISIMTLLHEMVHVEHWEWRGHGWRFNKRMLQLAKD